MGGCCCFVFLAVPALLASLFGVLLVPAVNSAFYDYGQSLEGKAHMSFLMTYMLRNFAYCAGDYLGCVKDVAADDVARVYGWDVGIAKGIDFANKSRHAALHFSHKTYRDVVYDPQAGRPPDMMVASHKSSLPPGVMPDGVEFILLNFDTGHPEHTARRQLLADALPGLRQDAPAAELLIPSTVKASDAAIFGPSLLNMRYFPLKRKVMATVGLNLFQRLFGADISEHLDAHYEYDGTFSLAVLGTPLFGFQGARLREIRNGIMAKVSVTDIAKKFVATAEERGMNGTQRLSEMVWIAMFAGYGGTGNLAFETLKHVLKDPAAYTKLYRKDPDAFMLEAARMYPPVGGMNPYAERKDVTYKLASGEVLQLPAGSAGVVFTSNANKDPTVFEDPKAFKPGRKNADRVLSWNAELRDFRSCASVAGCPEAPRGCPGTFLSLRVATEVVGFFVGGIEQALGDEKPSEL